MFAEERSRPPKLVAAFCWLGLVGLIVVFLVSASGLLIPFVLAVLVWFLLRATAQALQALSLGGRSLPPVPARALAVLLLGVAGWLTVRLIGGSVRQVAQAAPAYIDRLSARYEAFDGWFHWVDLPALDQVLQGVDLGSALASTATGLGVLAGHAALVLVYVVFLFLEARHGRQKILAIVQEEKYRDRASRTLARIEHDIRLYVGVKTFVSFLTAILSYVFMILVGLDLAGFWAVLVFVLNYIPNVGSIVATAFPALLALVQFDSLTPFLVILFGVGAVQFVIGNLIEPALMGDSLNVSPLVVIVSLVVWSTIWGIPGMFLCMPMTVVGMIVLANFDSTRWVAVLLSKTGVVETGDGPPTPAAASPDAS